MLLRPERKASPRVSNSRSVNRIMKHVILTYEVVFLDILISLDNMLGEPESPVTQLSALSGEFRNNCYKLLKQVFLKSVSKTKTASGKTKEPMKRTTTLKTRPKQPRLTWFVDGPMMMAGSGVCVTFWLWPGVKCSEGRESGNCEGTKFNLDL